MNHLDSSKLRRLAVFDPCGDDDSLLDFFGPTFTHSTKDEARLRMILPWINMLIGKRPGVFLSVGVFEWNPPEELRTRKLTHDRRPRQKKT